MHDKVIFYRIRLMITAAFLICVILFSGCTDNSNYDNDDFWSASTIFDNFLVVEEANFTNTLQDIENLQFISTADSTFDFSEAYGSISNISSSVFNEAIFLNKSDTKSVKFKDLMMDFVTELVSDAVSIVFKAGFYFNIPLEYKNITIGNLTVNVPIDFNINELYFAMVILFTPSELAKELMEMWENLWTEVLPSVNVLLVTNDTKKVTPWYEYRLFVKSSGIDLPLLNEDILFMIYPTIGDKRPPEYEPTADIGNLENIMNFYHVNITD